MAIRMRGWVALVAAAWAAVAITLLPPDRLAFPAPNESPEQLQYEEAFAELRRAHMQLQLMRWADSLAALVRSGAAGQETPGGIRVGAFLQPVDHGAVPGVPLGVPVGASLTFADLDDATPYCFTVHASVGGHPFHAEEVPAADLPDACALLARFGAPGSHVGAWLERGAWGFGTAREPAPDQLRLRDPSFTQAPYFGRRRHPLARENVDAAGCLAGKRPACARAILDPTDAAGPGSDLRAVAGRDGWSYADVDWSDQSPFRYLDDTILADLERQFGEEAFTRFWTSEDEVPVAFEAAFGVELGEWVLGWADNQMGLSRAGPGIALADTMLCFLMIGVLTALAGAVATRRRIA